ncbi:phosphoribosyl-AMP cyclohydrolase [Streptococcus sp. HF-1907]|uniref:phosphoribosyl-AMP cyclohydrolase n=1 Tax=Streptococcus sp. HF-1907 TaxID=2785793 RepID=UPI0018A07277|nr:phosphoribosyl-AMP cyclohydrolase [Streptococcus sp. HF-1907]MBF7094302.1 phosphoribosyl-AMP cyclohydrolase [Streptococcus sp. HF-1907]
MTAIKLDFDKQGGLVPVIVTDHETKQVLMLAYMNEEAFQLTKETKQMHYWSRSRNEIWHKGATSGHYQDVVSLKTDCDQDTLLAEVVQTGAACHTGAYSCFFNTIDLD